MQFEICDAFLLQEIDANPVGGGNFQPIPGQPTPIMGRLTDYGIKLLQMQMAYYQAFGDGP